MANLKDLIAAKDKLSAELLRGRLRGRATAMIKAQTIEAARKNAGRNVHGVGVGRKVVGGKKTKTLCVRLYVIQKLPNSALPRDARLPKAIYGVPTDVIEVPPARLHLLTLPSRFACSAGRRTRQRPFPGGVSAAHKRVNLTTLGCFCHSKLATDAGKLFMLSCNHAFADMNRGVPGEPILQPSPGDGGGASADGDRVGRLARFVPLRLDGSTPNLVDAAIAQVATGISVRNEVCTIGPLQGIKPASEGMLVRKHGRTTGYTEGKVESVLFDWTLQYTPTAWVYVVNQIFIEPVAGYTAFARGGDSGSVVVAKSTPHVVGLYFAGADDGSYGLANPIAAVCQALRISIP
jgi:hypothetical protein